LFSNRILCFTTCISNIYETHMGPIRTSPNC